MTLILKVVKYQNSVDSEIHLFICNTSFDIHEKILWYLNNIVTNSQIFFLRRNLKWNKINFMLGNINLIFKRLKSTKSNLKCHRILFIHWITFICPGMCFILFRIMICELISPWPGSSRENVQHIIPFITLNWWD